MSAIRIEKNIMVPMRDSTRLATDVYREVSSSNFPRFDRNSNTGGVIAQEAPSQFQPATNRVFHDASHPSCLILPIIER